VIFMGGLGIVLAGIIAGSGLPGTTVRFTGGPEDVLLMIAVFGLVIAFVADPVWQTKYEGDSHNFRDRRNTVCDRKRG